MGIESSSAGAAAGGSQAQALGAPKWDPNGPHVSFWKIKYKCPRCKWVKNIGLGALGVTNWQKFLPSGLKIQASILSRSEYSKSGLQKIWGMAKTRRWVLGKIIMCYWKTRKRLGPLVGAHLGPIRGPILFGTRLGSHFICLGPHLGPIWGPIFIRAIWPYFGPRCYPLFGGLLVCFGNV